jgi:hypothetical protein
VPGARAADVEHVFGEAAQHRFEFREHRVVGADHHVQPALLSLDRRARERRVDQRDAGRGAALAQQPRRIGLARRAVDDDQPGLGAGQQAVRTVDDGLDLGRPGDADEDDLAARRELGGALRLECAAGEQVGDRRAIAVHGEREFMPLQLQVLRDPVAHQSRCADESDPCHTLYSACGGQARWIVHAQARAARRRQIVPSLTRR